MGDQFFGVLPEGTVLQKYQIRQVLGRPGGFGVTYLAEDIKLLREVAVKEYLPNAFAIRHGESSVTVRSEHDRDSFEWGMKYFLKEAQVLARFHHRHIVQVYDFFEGNGTAYIVMEYARGDTLAAVLQRQGTLDQFRLSKLLSNILDGLEILHREGIYHRDIKPENIIIRPDGEPVLIDFGAARNALGSKSVSIINILTPGYAPIEQYGEKGMQGPWTDIYALAAVAYRVISGDKPPDAIARMGDDPLIPATQVGQGRYSERFLQTIDAALAFDAKSRPQNIAALRKLMDPPDEVSTLKLNQPSATPEPATVLIRPARPLSVPPPSFSRAPVVATGSAASDLGTLIRPERKVEPVEETSPEIESPQSKSRIGLIAGTVGVLILALAGGGIGWNRLHNAHSVAEAPPAVPAAVPTTSHTVPAPPPVAPAPPPPVNKAAAIDPATLSHQQNLTGTLLSHAAEVVTQFDGKPEIVLSAARDKTSLANNYLASGDTAAAYAELQLAESIGRSTMREFLEKTDIGYRQLAQAKMRSGDLKAADSALQKVKGLQKLEAEYQ